LPPAGKRWWEQPPDTFAVRNRTLVDSIPPCGKDCSNHIRTP
jgi:hypothetical protein